MRWINTLSFFCVLIVGGATGPPAPPVPTPLESTGLFPASPMENWGYTTAVQLED